MRIILVLSILFLLVGCSTTAKQTNLIVDEENKRLYVFPTKQNLEYCKDLPDLKGRSFGDLYKYSSVEIPQVYYECALKHKELSDWIERHKKDIEK